MALQPPTWPSQAISWRKLALWRAKKLGLPGVRHNHGLLLGSVRDAAAKITMMEFGLDPEKGGHNSSLLMQLLSLEDNQWQHLMEVGLDKIVCSGISTNNVTEERSHRHGHRWFTKHAAERNPLVSTI